MPVFCVKSVKIYTGQKKFTRIYLWRSWQISGMGSGSAFYGERVSPWSSLLLVASWGQQAMAPGIPPLHWSPLKKMGSPKNHVVCLLVFYSKCVLTFGVSTVNHFIHFVPKIKRRGILTEATHLYTSDKTSIFLWLALSIFPCFSSFFWGNRLCANKTLHIYWTEPPLKRVTSDLERFYPCCS